MGQGDDMTSTAGECADAREQIASLERRLARAEDRIVWIQELAAVLNNVTRTEELLETLCDRIERIVGAEHAFIFLVEEDQSHVSTRVRVDGVYRETRVPIGEGVWGWVARTGLSLNLKDASRDARYSAHIDAALGLRSRAVLCQPLRDKDQRLVGVIAVCNRGDGWFGVDDESLLSALASTVSVVIDNARLYVTALDRNIELAEVQRRLEDRVQRLDLLAEMQRRINEADDFHGVAEAIAIGAAETVEAAGCAVTVYADHEVDEYAFVRDAERGVYVPVTRSWDGSFRDEAIRSRRGMVVDRPSGEFASPGSSTPRIDVESMCVVPLETDRGAIGAIELINRRGYDEGMRRRSFDDEDRKLLSLLAAQLSGVVARTLRRQRERRNEQLAAIGRMLSGVVHDLRTPLTIISGNVQLIERAEVRERRHELADIVLAQIDHINQMMRELLAYARGESRLYLRNVSLAALAHELRDQLGLEFDDSGVALEVDARCPDVVRIDDGKVRRVLFNLARNAREAMTDGGHYRIEFESDDDVLEIRCIDDGPGIPEALRDRLFDAFVSSRAGGQNSGLGLAIVKKLVEEHGGTVSFDSSPGRGTTFVIRIPLVAPVDDNLG